MQQGKHMAEKKKDKKTLFRALFIAALIVFLGSGFMLLYEGVIEPAINRNTLDEYQQLYPGAQSSSSAPASTSSNASVSSAVPSTSSAPVQSTPASSQAASSKEPLPSTPLDTFAALLEKNKDTAGWLMMPGTELNNPVFYTPWDQNYYLKRNPDGSYNKYGSLYLSAGSTLNPQAQVLVMYGHNLASDDLMFGELKKHTVLSFVQKHPTFTFDTIYRTGEWKIIAVCRASTEELDKFTYSVNEYPSEKTFNAFVKEARLRSHFRIPDDVTSQDDLLVLSTCGEVFFGERIVVVARRLRNGEHAADIHTSAYKLNDKMKWPEAYYALDYVNATRYSDEETEQAYREFYGE